MGCARLSPFGAFLLYRVLCLLFFIARCAHAGQPFTPADWWNWRDIDAPRINSEGTSVVYVERWNLRDGDRICSNLWTVATAGGAPRRLTEGPWQDTAPAWSPDGGRIAYLSDREGKRQIWVRRMDSAADLRITHLEDPPLSVAWSPDGKSLAFTARMAEPPPPAAWAPAAILPLLAPPRRARATLRDSRRRGARCAPSRSAISICTASPPGCRMANRSCSPPPPPPDAAHAARGRRNLRRAHRRWRAPPDHAPSGSR